MTQRRSTTIWLALVLASASACGGPSSQANDGAIPSEAGADGARADARVDGDAQADTQSASPSLRSVAAMRAGRTGQDLVLAVEGGDPNGDIVRVAVRFVNQTGQPVLGVDSDADGVPDTAETSARLDAPVGGKTSFSQRAFFSGLVKAMPTATRAVTWLEDAGGRRSAEVEAAIAEQTILELGAECDPTLAGNRCQTGLACTGQPSRCSTAVAPALTRFAYLQRSGEVRIAAEGTDPGQILSSLSLEFFDAVGPVAVDMDGDDVADHTQFDLPCADATRAGTFTIVLAPAGDFGTTVTKLRGVPSGPLGLTGTSMQASLSAIPLRTLAQSCDYNNAFDECTSGAVCSPGIKGQANTCQSLATARSRKLSTAGLLSAGGKTRVAGVAAGTSVWEPPSGCLANDPVGRPEGVAILRLAAAQSQVTLTTDLPGTVFDTAIYAVKNHTTTAPTFLGCNDDGPAAPTSTLTLTDLAAGDYLIVVDSFNQGGNFELAVSFGQ